MTSLAKLEANRSNALKSTGPKTPAGKRAVARNAIKHGLLSREVVLPEEAQYLFRAFALNLCEVLQPEGALEKFRDRLLISRRSGVEYTDML